MLAGHQQRQVFQPAAHRALQHAAVQVRGGGPAEDGGKIVQQIHFRSLFRLSWF
ncbi:hypothetical protein JOS77_27745 [Chromobacterium haemolyticum]|nr:hypothetical protein JOS77_27745 [Chromobacterium haemolyticum]